MRRATALLVALVAATLARSAGAAGDKQQCLAASDQGQELRDDGKYAHAREAFATCARDVCPALVRHDCMKWLAELEQAWPSIVVNAKDDKGADLADVTVQVDGLQVLSRLDGTPTPVDPGEHVLRFDARGFPPVEQHVVVHAGEKGRALAVQFGTPAPPLAAPPPAPPTPAPGPDMGEGGEAAARASHGPGAAAWIFGGAAVAAFAAEAYFGLTGLSDRSSLKAQPCAATATCSSSSVDAIRTKFAVADVALGAGVVSAGLSLYFFVASPGAPAPARPAAFDVSPTPGGVQLAARGRF